VAFQALKVTRQAAPTRTVTTTTPFDYEAWLANNPTLQATLLQNRLAGQNLGTTLAGGVEQLYGRLGETPALTPQLAELLGPTGAAGLQAAIAAGQQAGTTTLAGLAHDYAGNQAETGAGYAARGGRSGGYGVHLNENLRQYTLGQYNARQQAADALGQLQQTYLSGQSDLRDQAATALTQARQRAGDLIHAGQLGPTTATHVVTNPYLNPTAPAQVSTRVASGSAASYEPRPTGTGYTAQAAAPRPAAPHALTAPRTTRVY
jgi:hypothetical protein